MASPRTFQAALLATPDDTEAQFYDALQHADLERLMAVWADDEEISCVHPSGVRWLGGVAIRNGFDEVFSQGARDTHPVRVRRLQMANLAVHHVLEEVRVVSERGPQTGYVLTTNVYIKAPQGWRLVVHHASPGSGLELQDGDAPAVLH